MDPTEKRDTPGEAILIRRARKALGLSPERIVERLTLTKMSSRNWRLIEDGRAAPPETIAHMAYVARVDPDQLAELHPEAAAILREIIRQQGGDEDPPRPKEMTRDEMIARAEKLMAEANDYLRRARGETG